MLDDFKPSRPNTPPKQKVPDGPMYVRPELRQQPTEAPAPVAEQVTPFDDIEVISQADIDAVQDKPVVKKQRLSLAGLNPKHWHKKQWLIFGSLLVVLLLGGAGGVYAFRPHTKPVAVAQPARKAAVVAPTKYYSPLTGMEATEAQTKNPVTGAMIENSQDARPQSGLDQAGVVFEAVAEGGITRFLALFQETTPSYLGPIRSVRPYYLDWLQGFDASIAHVGGSPEALAKIKTDGVKDLDQFYNGGSYTRITGRAAPHNVYTGLNQLQQLGQGKGYASSTFTAWPRKADSKIATPTGSSIDFAISSTLYNAHYDYDVVTNSYNRSEGGKPHIELDGSGNQTQIKPKVVIAMVINKSLESDGLHTNYGTIGTGQAFVFQDGGVTKATWKKDSIDANISFNDDAGTPIKLNAGQTWISIVPTSASVTYK